MEMEMEMEIYYIVSVVNISQVNVLETTVSKPQLCHSFWMNKVIN